MTLPQDGPRPIRISVSMTIPKGSKVIAVDMPAKNYVWLEVENFYGTSPCTIFLPDGTPLAMAEAIASAFNAVLTFAPTPEAEETDAIAD